MTAAATDAATAVVTGHLDGVRSVNGDVKVNSGCSSPGRIEGNAANAWSMSRDRSENSVLVTPRSVTRSPRWMVHFASRVLLPATPISTDIINQRRNRLPRLTGCVGHANTHVANSSWCMED